MGPLEKIDVVEEENREEAVKSVGSEKLVQQTERSSRRNLFGLGPAALLASLAACGETQFAGKKVEKADVNGDGDDGTLGTPDDPAEAGTPQVASGSAGPDEDTSGAAPEEKPPEEPKEEEFGQINVATAELGDLTKIGAVLFGTKDSAMLSFAFLDAATGLKEGDDLFLLRPVSKTKAFTMAMRTIWDFQQGDVPHVFDNISLVGIDEVHVLVVSGAKKTLYKIATKDADFERSFDDGTGAKALVDVPTNIAANHANYYDMMPVFNFDGPSTPIATLTQKNNANGMYKVASTVSQWTNASFIVGNLASGSVAIGAPNAALKMFVTDAIGRPVASSTGLNSVPIAPDILRKTNILVVYYYDMVDDHYHRYIYFVG